VASPPQVEVMPLVPLAGSTVVPPSSPTTRVRSATTSPGATELITSSVNTPLQVAVLVAASATQVPASATPLPDSASSVRGGGERGPDGARGGGETGYCDSRSLWLARLSPFIDFPGCRSKVRSAVTKY
jgi:hypothetical protein